MQVDGVEGVEMGVVALLRCAGALDSDIPAAEAAGQLAEWPVDLHDLAFDGLTRGVLFFTLGTQTVCAPTMGAALPNQY